MTADQDPLTVKGMFAQGGRVTTAPVDDTSVRVTVTGGRFAQRIDSHHAVLTCGECHQQADIERADGQPLADHDISEALSSFTHDYTP